MANEELREVRKLVAVDSGRKSVRDQLLTKSVVGKSCEPRKLVRELEGRKEAFVFHRALKDRSSTLGQNQRTSLLLLDEARPVRALVLLDQKRRLT